MSFRNKKTEKIRKDRKTRMSFRIKKTEKIDRYRKTD